MLEWTSTKSSRGKSLHAKSSFDVLCDGISSMESAVGT